jgi:hypothetical protein
MDDYSGKFFANGAHPSMVLTAAGKMTPEQIAALQAAFVSKYASLDDKIDGLHWYTTWIKFGLGRASYDAAQEIRNGHRTREEGVALVRRFDGEYPERYIAEVLEHFLFHTVLV